MHGTSLGTHPTYAAFARLRVAARDARLHGTRDGGQPCGGGAAPCRRPAALRVRRHRDSGDDVRRDRRRGASAFPGPQTELGGRWIRAPLLGVAHSIGDQLSHGLGGVLEFYVGITGALILLVAVTTSISGSARLAYSLGEHGQLPRSFGRLSRRAHVSPQAIARRRAHLIRHRHCHLLPAPRRRVPGELVLVRCADRVHCGPARR